MKAFFIIICLSRPSGLFGFFVSNVNHPPTIVLGINSQDSSFAPILDKIPDQYEPLILSAVNATGLRGADTSNQGHDSFRYEWGTWVDDEAMKSLMERIDEVRLQRGVYEQLVAAGDDDTNASPARIRLLGGKDWDCFLHALPPGTDWTGRWPGGSWAIVKTLTGMAEISAVTGPDRDGNYKVKTSRALRGGSDGSLGGGQSSAGENCVKYVGGPLRRYAGKYGKPVLLEVVVRPPIGLEEEDTTTPTEPIENLEKMLSIVPMELEMEDAADSDTAEKEKQSNGVNGQQQQQKHLGTKMGMSFDQVGGLDAQLDAIARRVLASRANPAAARRLGVSHVRGILLSGPPGCGKTLLARELARMLGAREPQIVNGPEILDKYIGEAEKKVRELFAPAEAEYRAAGDDSALHIIILDEMDAIARKRGTMTSDTTGVRDSVVNQLLAKMDGVKQASNVLVVGLTNRPELLDPALLRPGRLEVQLRIELPDLSGRRDILRIHTRRMREAGGLSKAAVEMIESLEDDGVPARTEHYSGAELAGLIRSAASFALGRSLERDDVDDSDNGVVGVNDIEQALGEVQPALGRIHDEVLKARFPLGISPCSPAMNRIIRDLQRFTSPVKASQSPRLQSLLLVGAGGTGGAGATALAAWAASEVSTKGQVDYVRFVTALDMLSSGGSAGDEARASALVEKFAEAREMPISLLVLDDVDQLCAGSGPGGYSSVMLATLRALLRSPPGATTTLSATKVDGDQVESKRSRNRGKTLYILAATSRSDAACNQLHELFDETIVVPLLQSSADVAKLLDDSLLESFSMLDAEGMAELMIQRLGQVGCKTALRLAERALSSTASMEGENLRESQLTTLANILDDLAGDEALSQKLCEVIL
ncbi:hypothetical protein ACA910_005816 [Epithemia clementina (nom. ined.)]